MKVKRKKRVFSGEKVLSCSQEILSRTTHWPCGYYEPSLTPAEIELGEKKSESDLTDVEILEQDLVKCLFRMNVLKRSVYLLNGMKLLPALTSTITVKNIFHILIRMARHSMTCANQVSITRSAEHFINIVLNRFSKKSN